MTDHLPQSLLRLFEARPPIPYLVPLDAAPQARKAPTFTGVSQYIDGLQNHDPDYIPIETLEQKRMRKRESKKEAHEMKQQEALKRWDSEKSRHQGDAYKTLFVGRLNYDTTENRLYKEMDYYGKVRKVTIIRDLEGNSRGYGFVEFERERDLKAAYKDCDARKIDGRRIIVDVERGRTVKGWRPRRLGGGLGYTRAGSKYQNQKYPGRDTKRSL